MIYKNCTIAVLYLIWWSLMLSCEEYVDVGTPNSKVVSATVFSNDETAMAAVLGIYNELAKADFSRGYLYSVTVLAGLSPDIFEVASSTDTRYGPFQQNAISPIGSDDATANYRLWSSAYNIIYMANSVLEGTNSSKTISKETRDSVGGQALFIRAFIYFYLTNLYGDIPLVLTTDFRQNSVMAEDPAADIYEQIGSDLDLAMDLLAKTDQYQESERTNVTLYAAMALRARVHLFQKEWEKAEELAGDVISQTSLYGILDDLDQVFLANSREAIWQISPLGRGVSATYTGEGYMFRGNNSSPIKLSDTFLVSIRAGDNRLSNWTGFNSSREFHYPQKYKDGNSRNNITEYSMVLRLAEQYLIRTEARAQQGKLTGAIDDLDKIRQRAGLEPIAETDPNIGKEDLLVAIMEERKWELFSEWGHRWLDLKRTGRATEVLGPVKPFWQDTDVLFPIPGEEREKNPNLGQNDGY